MGICKEKECKIRAGFGLEGKREYCVTHKTEEMEDNNNSSKRCKEKECKIRANFGLEGKREYCVTHKTEEMEDNANSSKRCKEKECKIRANFGLEGNREYCVTHKTEEMEDNANSSKRCKEKECKIRANFGLDGKNDYCVTHKTEEMECNNAKRCKEKECKIRASFGLEGKCEYCVTHKTEEMEDNNVKRCKEKGCKICAIFGLEGKREYCVTHKTEEMEDNLNKRCKEKGCKKRAGFGLDGKREYCVTHKTEEMEDNINSSKRCKTPLCPVRAGDKYRGYCMACFMQKFPGEKVARNYKTKECSVVEFVKNEYQDLRWIADKMVNGGGSRKRPDLRLDMIDQVLVIEIDEFQHKSYDCNCELIRMAELYEDNLNRPIIFIRFNPDTYIKNGENIKSCWGFNGNGIFVIKQKEEWEKRLDALNEQIKYWINPGNKIDKPIEIIQLFYDQ